MAPLLKSCDPQEGTFTHSCSFIKYLLSTSSVPDSRPGPGDASQQTGSALRPNSESLGQVGWRKPGPTALRRATQGTPQGPSPGAQGRLHRRVGTRSSRMTAL